MKTVIAKKDKLLSDCIELKQAGWLHNRYEIHLTEDFKNISQLDGKELEQALIAYRQHPATLRDPNPAWITKVSYIGGFIGGASFLEFFKQELTIGNTPFTLLFCFMMALAARQSTEDTLDFAVHYYRGERTRTTWRQKYCRYNIKFNLLESLPQWQQNEFVFYLPPLYRLTEAVKKQIESRIPEQELKNIQEIKHFEEKVNTLVNKHNQHHRQSWCEWFSFGFLFRNQRAQPDADQADQLQLGS